MSESTSMIIGSQSNNNVCFMGQPLFKSNLNRICANNGAHAQTDANSTETSVPKQCLWSAPDVSLKVFPLIDAFFAGE